MPESKRPLGAAARMVCHVARSRRYAAEPLRIGVPTDLSGTYATLGDEVMRAVRFAVDEANADGGVAGHKVEYKSYDTEAKPDLARRQSEKLVSEGYPILTGLIASGEGLAIAPLMERWGSIYVSTINKADELTGANCVPRVFRVNTQSAMDAATVKPWLAGRKEKKWAVVAIDIAWGRGSGDLFVEGGEVARQRGRRRALHAGQHQRLRALYRAGEEERRRGRVGRSRRTRRDQLRAASQAIRLDGHDHGRRREFHDRRHRQDARRCREGRLRHHQLQLHARYAGEQGVREGVDREIQRRRRRNFEGETYLGMQVIFQAVAAANSVKPDDVAKAMSGHEFDTIMGKLTVRAEDHQLLKPNYFGVVEHVDGALRPVIKTTVSAADVAPPVTCKLAN